MRPSLFLGQFPTFICAVGLAGYPHPLPVMSRATSFPLNNVLIHQRAEILKIVGFLHNQDQHKTISQNKKIIGFVCPLENLKLLPRKKENIVLLLHKILQFQGSKHSLRPDCGSFGAHMCVYFRVRTLN